MAFVTSITFAQRSSPCRFLASMIVGGLSAAGGWLAPGVSGGGGRIGRRVYGGRRGIQKCTVTVEAALGSAPFGRSTWTSRFGL